MPNKLFFSRPTGQPQLGHHDSCHKSLKLKPIETKKRKERKRERKRKKYTISNEFIFISQNLSSIFKFLNSPSAPNPFHRPLIRGRKKEIKIEARCGARNKPATLLILIVTQNQNICSARQTLRGERWVSILFWIIQRNFPGWRIVGNFTVSTMDKRAAAAARKIQRQNEHTFRIDHHCYTVARDGVWFFELNTTGLIYATGSIDRLMESRRGEGWVYSASLRIFHRILFHFFRGGNNFYFFFFFLFSWRKFDRFFGNASRKE